MGPICSVSFHCIQNFNSKVSLYEETDKAGGDHTYIQICRPWEEYMK